MKPKFEIGDRVRCDNMEGVIVGVDAQTHGCLVRYDNDDEEHYVRENELEFVNSKMTFLARLQELLATFDANISFGANLKNESFGVILQERENRIFYPFKITETKGMVNKFGIGYRLPTGGNYPITAENIFDYGKD